MTSYKLNENEILAVKVPKDASDIQLHKIGGIDEYCITYFTEKPFAGTERVYLPPPGSYSILGRGMDLKEEQWRRLVEYSKGSTDSWKDYEHPSFVHWRSTASGLSWLKANGIDENYLLIIKN